ncbi:MAG: TonB-dependent receptor [Marinilabilia sp.]
MRFTLFFLMTNLLVATASDTFSQSSEFTIKKSQVTISDAFEMIKENSKFNILYKSKDLDVEKTVDLNLKNATIEELLNQILAGEKVDYIVKDNQVIIHKEEDKTRYSTQPQDERSISGTVRDADGGPIPGVSIVIEGTNTGTTTNEDGQFSIEANASDVLVFSFIGMETQEIEIQQDTEELNISLQESESELDEVTVVGFGEQRKVSVTGSVETTAPEDLQIPSSNISNSFAGRLAGVIAFQRTGEPGADASNFYIRGISTFSGATNPLIIIDGVEASSADLNALPPEAIESFSVLKDATATSLYGTKGANGVMIVETKSGRDQEKATINVRLENSVSTPTSVPEFADGPRFMEMYNEAILGRSTGDVPYSQTKIDGTRNNEDPYLFPNVDWYDELFRDYAMNQTANVSVRGGGKKMDYFMNVSANLDNGILDKFDVNSYDNNVKVQRYSFQNNINARLTPTTDVSLKLNTRLRQNNGPAIGAQEVFGLVMEANPADFPIIWPDEYIPREEGEPTLDHTPFGGKGGGRYNNGYLNPFAEMVKGYSEGFQSTVTATLNGEQKLDFIAEGLQINALASFKNWSQTSVNRSGGVNQYEVDDITTDGDSDYNYDFGMVGNIQDPTLNTSTSNTGDRSIYFETQLEYNRSFGPHRTSGMLLYTQDEYMVNDPGGLIQSLPQRKQGLAGRFTYSYNDRYLIEANFGYNGSENFAENKRFGFFPSLSLGYVMSNENFWTSDVVSLLKLRGSWGEVGNDQIGGQRFVYLSDIDLSGTGYTTGRDMNYSRSGPVYNRYENQNISWEVGEKINLGIDIGLFDNNVNLVADFYREIRDGIFLERQVIPTSFGTADTDIYGNLGKVKNQGIDLALDINHSFSDDFHMQMKSTFTLSQNEVLDRDEPPFTQYPNRSRVGHPINTLWGYQAERLFIDQAEIDNSPTQQLGGTVLPGDIKYSNISKEKGYDDQDLINSNDQKAMGHPTTPEIVYGFGPSFQYKDLDFSFFFQGVARTSFFINNFHPFGSSSIRNVLKFIEEDYWSQDNQDIYADYPRLSKQDHPNNTANSSYWLRDGSFLKLKNAEIGYTHDFLRVYVRGMNLLTFSEFDLWDPEMGGGNGLSYPTQRVVNVGVQLNL